MWNKKLFIYIQNLLDKLYTQITKEWIDNLKVRVIS